jgi:hypothetical protein
MPNLDDLVPLTEAARMVPGGRTVSPVTLWRWTTAGLMAPDGKRVKLAAYRCGKRLCTTRTDMVQFFAAAGGQDVTAPGSAANV